MCLLVTLPLVFAHFLCACETTCTLIIFNSLLYLLYLRMRQMQSSVKPLAKKRQLSYFFSSYSLFVKFESQDVRN